MNLSHMERRLLAVRDSKIRRCWFCGSWAYDTDDCRACAAPAARTTLTAGETA